MSDFLLEANHIKKNFNEGDLNTKVLKDINFKISIKQSVAIIGSSGSGKSTLLHILGGLDLPDQGEVIINGTNILNIPEKKRDSLRNKHLGFVYQFHHLLYEFTAIENVAMPLLIRRDNKKQAIDKAGELLGKVGLSQRAYHKPGELSGGERQRAAIARALITDPDCILADEPTGNLDEKTSAQVFELILELNQNLGTSLIMVTHNIELSKSLDCILELRDGILQAN